MTTSYVYLPKTKPSNKGITWYNDDQLIKREDGQTMQALTLEDNRRRLNVEDLVDEIELLRWNGIETLKITQRSPKTGTKVFTVDNLTAELVDDLIICDDNNGAIIENSSPLKMFQESDVLSIYKTCLLNKVQLKIYYTDSVIVEIDEV